jgi:serine/threonine protein kinase/tetratricopeptide (TPR) repeat protein
MTGSPLNAKAVFDHAHELRSPVERRAYLDQACADAPELREKVEALLRAYDDAGSFLESSPPELGTVEHRPDEGPGSVIGPYKLLQLIGEGGMGVVYMAEQEQPVRRRVALKVIKPGMDSAQVIARFEAERQALAMMDHLHIAKVLDAGSTTLGRPYFVMELVRGVPITKFCDQEHLTPRERLELFVPVCQAVQHAHQKGVIHRDLKPSNILVTLYDGKPVPKVIDFGVAKALHQKLTDRTLFTDFGAVVGTLEYMAPEQAALSHLDVDTRSDVYSLGVLLYELLTGTTPFERKRLRQAALDEMLRIIREEEPPKPSTRLSQSGESLPSIAAQRKTEPAKLSRLVRGELDWIVMRALEKDRSRRYETANGIARDIQRYLAGEAVLAAPPNTAYRLRKFVRRNRAQVVAGGVVAASLVLGMIGTGLALKRALRAEWGLRRQLDETEKAQQAEKARADELKHVSDFQEKMLAQVDAATAGAKLTADVNRRFAAALEKDKAPEADRGKQASAFRAQWARVNATDAATALIDETILKPAVKAIDAQFKDQPVVDAQLRQTLAKRYRDLGLYDASFPLQKQAVDVRRRVLGEEHPDTLNSISNMGALLHRQGKYAAAEAYYREALEKRRRVLGEEHPDAIESINNLGLLLLIQGKFAEAEPYYREALEKSGHVLGKEHPFTLISIRNMGLLLNAQGKHAAAEPFFREALEKRRRVLGEEHPDTLDSIISMGVLLLNQGKRAAAEPYVREALEKQRRVLGEEHPNTLTSINLMGVLLHGQGKRAAAEPYVREALEKRRRVLGEEHPDTIETIYLMGFLLEAQGKRAEAEPYFRDALEKKRRVLGEEHANTLLSINTMGALLQAQGKLAEAEPYYREALEKRRRVLGEEHPDTLVSINNMGFLLQAQGKLAEAEPYYREAVEKRRRVLGEEHQLTLVSIIYSGDLLREMNKPAEAIELLAPSEAAACKAFTGVNPRILALMLTTLGRARVTLGYNPNRFNVAETNLLEAHQLYVKTGGEKHKNALDCVQGLIDIYTAWDKAEPGKGYDAKAREWKARLGDVPATSNKK